MPVPTDTFWNIRRLNIVFAVSAVLLLGSTMWLVMEDWGRAWRQHQQDGKVWETAMTVDAARAALSDEDRRELRQLEADLIDLRAALRDTELENLQNALEARRGEKARKDLPLATVKGEINPLRQQLEGAILLHGEGSAQAQRLRRQLRRVEQQHDQQLAEMAQIEEDIRRLEAQVAAARSEMAETQRQIDALVRRQRTLEEKLAELNPQGRARLGKILRDAPLLDWFNPEEKVRQVVVPDVRTDLNFITVETIDRCNTCHVNIDRPEFEESNLLLFTERQVARAQGQDVNVINHPVVLLGFWEQAAAALARGAESPAVGEGLRTARARALAGVNERRGQAGLPALASEEELPQEFERIARGQLAPAADAPDGPGAAQWYQPLEHYLHDLRMLLQAHLPAAEARKLRGLYRHALVEAYNAVRKADGLPAVKADAVLLAHPRLDLFVGAESAHPMDMPGTSMGCTVCHEGSGQETEFKHTVHTPREMWVDARTGAPVPEFLVDPHGGRGGAPAMAQRGLLGPQGAQAAAEAAAPGAAVYTHHDVNLNRPGAGAPFAPDPGAHEKRVAYHDLTAAAARREAVRQEAFWKRVHRWEHVHYMHWEKPMHSLEYVESSCLKCHTEVFDVKDAAPRLFEGRALFAQLGCVNCHAVESIQDQLDVKRVGPSLVHVKEKLSPEMMASWIWSPKAFRPTSRMPHFFMLENNSSPVDVARTRVEVAAMTHYLLTAPPQAPRGGNANAGAAHASVAAYQPEAPPAESGEVHKGRVLFNALGCLGCHTNLDGQLGPEHRPGNPLGEQWILEDLQKRGYTAEQAAQRYEAMDYNRRHQYAVEHLGDKLELTGPELSGVGTKLNAGRSLDEARQWTYDWLRNPRHYSSYTIMPSFRLSEEEANHLTAYLLSLERPGYEPQSFALDQQGEAMLEELVVTLRAGQLTRGMIREDLRTRRWTEAEARAAGKPQLAGQLYWTAEEQLAFLGQKMIAHYGCNGCHAINGFETVGSACVNLDEWGLKDPHKLDFGYFDHAFDAERQKPTRVWKVEHEGLAAAAPQIAGDSEAVRPVELHWEHLELERRPWLYHKLHNTRVYDRGRTLLDSPYRDVAEALEASRRGEDALGRPYDKIKMPKFFLTDEQVRSLVTFVTGVRKPMVSATMQQSAYGQRGLAAARGRQLATLYNCYGCHNIEGNQPHIQQFYDIWQPDGSKNLARMTEIAPPRLVGQGARVQPNWMHHFLRDVEPLRPFLTVRMPSFPLTSGEATALVDYFGAHSQLLAGQLGDWLAPVDAFLASQPEADWFDAPALAGPTDHLAQFAVIAELAQARDLDPRDSSLEMRRETWARVLADLRFLRDTYPVEYPFPPTRKPQVDAERFARGEALYNELKCVQCHLLGEPDKAVAVWHLENPDAEAAPAEEADPYGDMDEAGYGDDEGYGEEPAEPEEFGPPDRAPNMIRLADRIQYDWSMRWVQNTQAIMPGSSMPPFFEGGDSAFAKYPAEMRQQLESMYGYSGPEQMRLLLDYLYAASDRRYTPGAEKLVGLEAPKVELRPLAPPPEPARVEQPAGEEPDAGAPPAPLAETPAPAAPVGPPPPEPTVSAIELHEGAQPAAGTRIVGVVRFEGNPGPRRPVRMAADQTCVRAHTTPPLDPTLIVNRDGALRNAFVSVKAGLPAGQRFAAPSPMVEMDQQGCEFLPRLLGVVAGQRVRFLNSDPTMHNVKFNSQRNGNANVGLPAPGMEMVRAFATAEEGAIEIKCDVHPWMTGYVYVLAHPFFAVSDVEGRFEITGLPPGRYTLEARHEGAGIAPVSFEVEVPADTSQRADVSLRR